MAAKLFISYSRHDFPFMRDLVRSLREAGMDLWLDVTSLSGGERWNTRIETALKECTHCLVVVSPYSMKSAQVAHEVEVADQHQKQIIPVLLQTANLSERLQTTQLVVSVSATRQPCAFSSLACVVKRLAQPMNGSALRLGLSAQSGAS